jgi:hypothetical protein
MNTSEANAIDLTKPVQTRDGRKARILCIDANNDYPIVGLYEYEGSEQSATWMLDGTYLVHSPRATGYDLVNVPEPAAALESRVTKERELLTAMSAWMDYHIVMFPEVFGEAREREGRALLERYAALYAAPAAALEVPMDHRPDPEAIRRSMEDIAAGRVKDIDQVIAEFPAAPSPAPSPQEEKVYDWPTEPGEWQGQYTPGRTHQADSRRDPKGDLILHDGYGFFVCKTEAGARQLRDKVTYNVGNEWRRVTPPASQELEELNVICSENAAEAHRLTAPLADANAKVERLEGEVLQAKNDAIDQGLSVGMENVFLERANATLSVELADARAYKDAWARCYADSLPCDRAEMDYYLKNTHALAQPAAAEAVKAERPERPPMLLAKNEREEWRWWLRTKGLHRNSWTTGCMNGAKGTIACESDAFDAIDRDASDPRAVELFDADLAASNEGSAT